MRRESVPGPTARRSSRGPRSPDAAQRRADMFSDGNDADQSAGGETTEDADGASGLEDSDEKPRAPAPAPPVRAAAATLEQPDVGEEEDTTEGEDEMDAEARRKLELRERMAKMSGGMGMAGMFGPPGGMPMPGMPQKKTKPSAHSERKGMDESGVISPASPTQTQRMPMVPIPGMQRPQSPEPEDTRLAVQKEDEPTHNVTNGHVPEAVPDVEDLQPQPAAHQQSAERGAPPLLPHERAGPPPIPSDRPVPQPPPAEPRLAPPLPSAMPQSPSAGSESDDEMSLHARGLSAENRTDSEMTLPIRSEAPPALDTGLSGGAPNVPTRPSGPRSPQSPASKRASYFNSDPSSPISPTGPGPMDKRSSRMPPIPISSPTMTPPGHARLPPPPPPPTAAPPSRQPTMDVLPRSVVADVAEGEETEYEGDYDTDIASGATHKDALRSYARDSSLDDSGAADEIPQRSQFLPAGVPPPPPPRATVPRAVPPPPPLLAPKTRQSMDAPRAAPPPIPPTRRIEPNIGDNEYDPYRYGGPVHPVPPAPASMLGPYAAAHGTETPESEDDDLYSASPPRTSMERLPPLPPQAPPHQERPVPPPPSQNAAPPNRAPSTRAPPRQSLDVQRTPTIPSRRSMEQFRPSSDQGFIATDVDLGERAQWWAQANVPPPVFQNRKDVLYEIEESSTSKRGGRTTISKDVYVLFSDYSQTVITARFDSVNTTDSSLEQ
ncbi:assembly of actin patch protein, partial [Cryomyces antarcticus]